MVYAQPDAADKFHSKADGCPSMLTESLHSRHSMQSSMSFTLHARLQGEVCCTLRSSTMVVFAVADCSAVARANLRSFLFILIPQSLGCNSISITVRAQLTTRACKIH